MGSFLYRLSGSYTQQKKVFALSSLANVPSYIKDAKTKDELQSRSQEKANEVLKDKEIIKLIGKWKIVWGFQIFQKKSILIKKVISDNAVFVAQNMDDPNELVVSIAGTNGKSIFGWFREDFKLNPPVAWEFNEDSTMPAGNIATGTSIGLDIVLNKLKDNGLSLTEFLSPKVVKSGGKKLNITIAGRSLGGTLSAPVALALLDTQGTWDPKFSAEISVQPCAGLTPGDKVWRDYYDDKLGGKTDRLWNELDVAPRCWNVSTLQTIPKMYEKELPKSVSTFVKSFIEFQVRASTAFAKSSGSAFEQICPNTPPLPGSKICPVTVNEYATLLEELVLNKVIDIFVGVPEDVAALMVKKVSKEIKKLNNETDKSKEADMDSIINELQAEGIDKVYLVLFQNLLTFLSQALCQHLSAYDTLLGTERFSTLANIMNK